MKSMFANVWTTVLGIVAGVVTYALQSTTVMPSSKAEWGALLQGALLAALGIFAKDATTGSKPGP